jgi:hypothetical protein
MFLFRYLQIIFKLIVIPIAFAISGTIFHIVRERRILESNWECAKALFHHSIRLHSINKIKLLANDNNIFFFFIFSQENSNDALFGYKDASTMTEP